MIVFHRTCVSITKVKKDFIESEMDKVLADEIKEIDSYIE